MADETNPWLSRPAAAPTTAPAYTQTPTPASTGPLTPQRGVPAPDAADQLPAVTHHRTADLWWLGAHGGAGETSLAALEPRWAAAEHGWPRTPATTPTPVVVTVRSNARGLRAAQVAAMQWAAGLVPHVQVVGLVVVADAPGRLPRPLRDLIQLVAGGYPRSWSVPWIEAWRLGEDPDLSTAPRDVRRLVDDLTALLHPGAAGATH